MCLCTNHKAIGNDKLCKILELWWFKDSKIFPFVSIVFAFIQLKLECFESHWILFYGQKIEKVKKHSLY